MVPHWAVVAATSSLGPAQTAPAIPNSTSSSTTGDRWRFITGPPPSRVFVFRLAPRGLLRDSFRDASPRRRRTPRSAAGASVCEPRAAELGSWTVTLHGSDGAGDPASRPDRTPTAQRGLVQDAG